MQGRKAIQVFEVYSDFLEKTSVPKMCVINFYNNLLYIFNKN